MSSDHDIRDVHLDQRNITILTGSPPFAADGRLDACSL